MTSSALGVEEEGARRGCSDATSCAAFSPQVGSEVGEGGVISEDATVGWAGGGGVPCALCGASSESSRNSASPPS